MRFINAIRDLKYSVGLNHLPSGRFAANGTWLVVQAMAHTTWPAAAGVELPELMTSGRWKSSRMPTRYTERQALGRGAVARFYQRRVG